MAAASSISFVYILASRRGTEFVDLHGDDNRSLVSWFGYRDGDYDLVRHAHSETVGAFEIDSNRILNVRPRSPSWTGTVSLPLTVTVPPMTTISPLT